MGITDTYRGISQVLQSDEESTTKAPGYAGSRAGALNLGEKSQPNILLADPKKMKEREERLNQILQDNPTAGWAGYIGGLIMDPAGWLPWTAPARRLQQINAVRKLYQKTGKVNAAKKLAIEAAGAGSAGAGVGALGYVDENAINPLTGKPMTRADMAIMGGTGSAILGPAFQAAGRKWGRAPKQRVGPNPDPESRGLFPVDKGGGGHRVWNALSKPGPVGAAYGGALGGYAGWQSTEEQELSTRLAALGLGTLGGAAGGATAIKKIGPHKFISNFNLTDENVHLKNRKAGETAKIYKEEIQPTLEKISKLAPEENRALYGYATEKNPSSKLSHLNAIPGVTPGRVTELEALGIEIRSKVDKLAQELVDLGVLDSKIQAKNADSYLHRLFDDPEKAYKALKNSGVTMVGDEFKARGKVERVSRKKWKEMQDDMANPLTSSGAGKTNMDAGGKWLDESGGLVRRQDNMEWEEWDMVPREKKAHDAAVAEHYKKLKAWEDRRVKWAQGNDGHNAVAYQEALDRITKAHKLRRAKKQSPYGEPTPAEINSIRLNDEEIRKTVLAAEKAVDMPPTFRTTAQPKEPRLPDARIRRDWTPEERKYMGEIISAYDSFKATGQLLSNDVAAARFLHRMSKDRNISSPDSPAYNVRKGEDGLPVNLDQQLPMDKHKYGDLSGMYVSKETAFDLGRMNAEVGVSRVKATRLGQKWSKFNGYWKGTKTILNPNVHMNNFMSNVMHYDHGVTDLGAKKWLWLGKSMHALATGSKGTVKIGGKTRKVQELLDEAEEAGMFGGGMMAELGQTEVARIMRGQASVFTKGDPFQMQSAAINIADKVWRKSKAGAQKWLWDVPGKVYQYEDNVFRFALYMAEVDKLVTRGISPDKAGGMAARKGKDWFVNYEDVPEALAVLRELPIPFLSYMWGIIPRIAETAVKSPAKIAKWSGMLALINEVGWETSDISYEDRRDIEHLQENQADGFNSRWGIPGMGPKQLKVGDRLNPFSEQGEEGFLDLSRAYAGGNIFGGKEGEAGSMKFLPEWLQANFGAAGGIIAPLMGYDLYKGKNIPAGMDRFAAVVQQFIPNFPLGEMINSIVPGAEEITNADILPETYAGNKIQRARSGNFSETKDVHTLPTAWASLFGIKLKPVSSSKLQDRIYWRYDSKIRLYDKKISNLGNELSAGGISEDEYERKVGDLIKKQEMVIKQLSKALNRGD